LQPGKRETRGGGGEEEEEEENEDSTIYQRNRTKDSKDKKDYP
jgi:hypothetical protein